jgi:anti-sigma regulatory factor (Ser/Thr protein kinase)
MTVEEIQPAETRIRLDVYAPAAARLAVERYLCGRVADRVLNVAQLLASELVTNSVRHSGLPDSEYVVVRVHVWRGLCRLEVEDPGGDGVIALRSADQRNGGGMGLNLVELLSDRWGVIRAAHGPTRVWVQLTCRAPWPTAWPGEPLSSGPRELDVARAQRGVARDDSANGAGDRDDERRRVGL